MTCPSREDLFAYLIGAAAEDSAEALSEHAHTCDACRAALTRLDDASDGLISQLRRPVEQHAYLKESQCLQALARAEAIGSAPSASGEESSRRPPPDAPLAGQLGEYRLLAKLGEGGMGVVYKALHAGLGRLVALKVLPMGPLAGDRAIARFRREIQALGRLDHPHIVRALDAREIEGTRFLVMEYVDGLDLSELVRRVGPLPVADACELARQAALALQYAHEHGLVHRDVKPSNLMLSRDGAVKLLDLGLARFRAERAAGKEMTATGQAMGTADYMAPEQVSDSHEVDIRADIYSLGCTLYKLLSGHAPFSGPKYKSAFEKMTAHVAEPVPPIQQWRADLPDELLVVLNRMLAKHSAQRHATPGEVAEWLEQFAVGCDLAKLSAEAAAPRGYPAPLATIERQPVGATPEYYSSAQLATQPSRAFEPRPSPIRRVRPWKRLALIVGLALAGIGAGLAFQVIVRIVKDGRETTLRVPDGGEIRIDLDSKRRGAAVRPRPSRSLLLREDFAGRGLPQGWRTARGEWKVEDGALAVRMSQPYYPGFAFAPAAAWRDYAVGCELRLDQAAAGIIFRHNAEDRFYACVFRHEEAGGKFGDFSNVAFFKYQPCEDKRIDPKGVYGGLPIAQREYVLTRGKYHDVRVEVVANTMRLFVDGKFVLDAEDRDDMLESGSTGLVAADAAFKPGIASFRSFRIESLGDRWVADWEFEERQGATTHDVSGNGSHATLQGGVTWVAGRDGQAVLLNGIDGFFRAPDHPSQSGMKRLTIHTLLKLHSLPKGETAVVRKWGPLADARGPEDNSFLLGLEPGGTLAFQTENGVNLGMWVARSKPISLDQWIEVVAVYDGLRNTLYTRLQGQDWAKYEGFLLPSKVQGFTIRDTQEPIEMGCDLLHRFFLNATIDWIRIYAGAQPPALEPE